MQRFLRKVDHVRAVERPAGLRELLLTRGKQAIDPWEQFFGAMVGVENDRRTPCFRRRIYPRVMRAGDAAEDRSELVLAFDVFADEELRAAIRELNHRRRV